MAVTRQAPPLSLACSGAPLAVPVLVCPGQASRSASVLWKPAPSHAGVRGPSRRSRAPRPVSDQPQGQPRRGALAPGARSLPGILAGDPTVRAPP